MSDPSLDNPLGALVTNDLNGRMAVVRSTISLMAMTPQAAVTKTQKKWSYFISLAETSKDAFGLMSLTDQDIDDVRVAPLVKTKWHQDYVYQDTWPYLSCLCYNYYTPNNYPCGCIATAMAQLMRYHQHPTTGIGEHEFTIRVDGVERIASTCGGDGEGGPYDWNDMVLVPNYDTPERQLKAIGALCYDTGIAAQMKYQPDPIGSSTTPDKMVNALLNTFKYSNAVLWTNHNNNFGNGELNFMISPNLDAGYPVILGIFGPEGGHSVVCDGYGYEFSTLYHHLNIGGSGVCDLWYELPDIECSSEQLRTPIRYDSITTCIYNIFTSGSGEIISGRVLNFDDKPADANIVCLEYEGEIIAKCQTNQNGIFAFTNVNSNTDYTLWVERRDFPRQQVLMGTSRNGQSTTGNVWGVYFHVNPPQLYVDDDAANDPAPYNPNISDPVEDGSAEHPFDAIQEAIDAAMPGDIVIVLAGTYTGDGNRDLDLKCKPITVRSADPNDPNLVVINCSGSPNDPHRGFYIHSGEKAVSVVKGFTIIGGYYDRGAGIYCVNDSSPKISNCIIRNNTVSEYGGGMYNENSSPTLISCTFSENSAGEYGGGMCNVTSSPKIDCIFTGNSAKYGAGIFNDNSNPTVVSCIFYENTAQEYGGAIVNNNNSSPRLDKCQFSNNSAIFGGGLFNESNSCPILTDCNFFDNEANVNGGGMNNWKSSSPTITGCTFRGNTATWNGGGVYNGDNSCPILTDCSFLENDANLYGGGICNENNSGPVITGCTFGGNSADEVGGGMFNKNNSSPTITGCTFSGNSAEKRGGGIYNEASSPRLTNCMFSRNSADECGGGMYSQDNSRSTLTNCTFSGNSANLGGGILTVDSSPTLTNCILWGDTPDEIYISGGNPVITYSDIPGVWPGEGNIYDNPLFADAATGDYHLKSQAGRWDPISQSWIIDEVTSPCIDAGDPGTPVGLEPLPNGGIINMGAYGGTAEASKSPAN